MENLLVFQGKPLIKILPFDYFPRIKKGLMGDWRTPHRLPNKIYTLLKRLSIISEMNGS
jgi:hypothetical protein